jgi:hypothetical protein
MSKGAIYLTTKVLIAPLSGITSLTAPKLTEWGSGVATTIDISPQLLPTTKLPSYGADKTKSQMSITEGIDVTALVGSEASGWHIDWFHDYNPTTGKPATTDLRTTLFSTPSKQFAILIRNNIPWQTVLTVGDVVDVYQVTTGQVQEGRDFEEAFYSAVNQLHNLGALNERVVVVA